MNTLSHRLGTGDLYEAYGQHLPPTDPIVTGYEAQTRGMHSAFAKATKKLHLDKDQEADLVQSIAPFSARTANALPIGAPGQTLVGHTVKHQTISRPDSITAGTPWGFHVFTQPVVCGCNDGLTGNQLTQAASPNDIQGVCVQIKDNTGRNSYPYDQLPLGPDGKPVLQGMPPSSVQPASPACREYSVPFTKLLRSVVNVIIFTEDELNEDGGIQFDQLCDKTKWPADRFLSFEDSSTFDPNTPTMVTALSYKVMNTSAEVNKQGARLSYRQAVVPTIREFHTPNIIPYRGRTGLADNSGIGGTGPSSEVEWDAANMDIRPTANSAHGRSSYQLCGTTSHETWVVPMPPASLEEASPLNSRTGIAATGNLEVQPFVYTEMRLISPTIGNFVFHQPSQDKFPKIHVVGSPLISQFTLTVARGIGYGVNFPFDMQGPQPAESVNFLAETKGAFTEEEWQLTEGYSRTSINKDQVVPTPASLPGSANALPIYPDKPIYRQEEGPGGSAMQGLTNLNVWSARQYAEERIGTYYTGQGDDCSFVIQVNCVTECAPHASDPRIKYASVPPPRDDTLLSAASVAANAYPLGLPADANGFGSFLKGALGGLRKLLPIGESVAEMASVLPGPIGNAARGISTGIHAVRSIADSSHRVHHNRGHHRQVGALTSHSNEKHHLGHEHHELERLRRLLRQMEERHRYSASLKSGALLGAPKKKKKAQPATKKSKGK